MIAAATAAAEKTDNLPAWLQFAGVVLVAVISLIGVLISRGNGKRTKQLEPNGGSSLADSIRRMEKAVERIDKRTESHDAALWALNDTSADLRERVTRIEERHTDHDTRGQG